MIVKTVRFARTDDRDMLYVNRMRVKYPPPAYDPRRDGGWNPADGVLEAILGYDKKKLRKLCKKHALDHVGPRRKLVVRLYLHWRAAKLKIGKTYYGYDKGYESTRTPDCVCGCTPVAYMERIEKEKERRKLERKAQRKLLFAPRTYRFPRYKEGRIHFPRLK